MASLSITKSYEDGTIFFEADLDNIRDAIIQFVNSTKINDDNIQDGSIVIANLGPNLVDNVSIKKTTSGVALNELGITTIKLTSNSIVTAGIANTTLAASKINDGAVTAAKIQAGAVTTAKIPAGAVTSAKLASNSVTGSKIDNDQVTAAKLATGSNEDTWVYNRLAGGDLNDIGTIRMLFYTLNVTLTVGATTSGSNLCTSTTSSTSFMVRSISNANRGSTVSGTWRNISGEPLFYSSSGSGANPLGLFVRIS
jgi:hypothetical protein